MRQETVSHEKAVNKPNIRNNTREKRQRVSKHGEREANSWCLKLLSKSAIHHFPRPRQVQLEACMFEARGRDSLFRDENILSSAPMEIASKLARLWNSKNTKKES